MAPPLLMFWVFLGSSLLEEKSSSTLLESLLKSVLQVSQQSVFFAPRVLYLLHDRPCIPYLIRTCLVYCLFPLSIYIFFYNCSCPLLDGQTYYLLGVMIPMRHRLPSTDQHWRSYWSLTLSKSRCSRLNYSHFHGKKSIQYTFVFSVPWRAFLLKFFRGCIGSKRSPWKIWTSGTFLKPEK